MLTCGSIEGIDVSLLDVCMCKRFREAVDITAVIIVE